MGHVSTEAELVARCKRELPHQHSGFELLVARYKNMTYTLCYRLVGNGSDAEDLTQEVFTKVFLNLKGFEERSAFSSWIYRIAYNHCLNFLAKRKRVAAGMSVYASEPLHSQHTINPTEKLTERLQATLNQLSETQRSLVVMKYVIELDLKEISEIVGVSVGAVKMRLLRAREEFRRLYQQEIQGEG